MKKRNKKESRRHGFSHVRLPSHFSLFQIFILVVPVMSVMTAVTLLMAVMVLLVTVMVLLVTVMALLMTVMHLLMAAALTCCTDCTGIVTIAACMAGAAISLLSVYMPPRLGTALYITNAHNAAGAVAIAAGVIVTTVSLPLMNMISCLRTAFHRTYAYRAAGTVTIAALMVIPAIGLTIMGVQSGGRTIRNRAKPAHLIRGDRCLRVMSMSRYRHYHQSCRQQTRRTICQCFFIHIVAHLHELLTLSLIVIGNSYSIDR